jgi:methylmalonyl-CoA mutase
MSNTTPSQKLKVSEFSPATPQQWKEAAEKLLKGAPFDKKMITRLYEGLELQPIYTAGSGSEANREEFPGSAPFRRGSDAEGYVSHPWLVAQETSYATPEEANAALQSDLQRGQNAVYLRLDLASRLGVDADKAQSAAVGRDGLSISSIADLGKALAGVDLATTPVYIEADIAAPAIHSMVAALADKAGIPIDHLHGAIAADPLGLLVANGSLPVGVQTALDRLFKTAEWSVRNTPSVRTVMVNSRVYHNAGADAVQELALSIATGIEYVRALVERGLSIDEAAGQIWFSLSSGTNFFMEVAKFRAARILWATVINAFGGSESAQKMSLHVRTSDYTATAVDPYVNLLRATTEALAAGIGGCGSMHVGAFDEAIRPADEFSRRIARNTQIILQSEAHVQKVIDPAGGSWYVESLTDEVATRSWKLVQEVEAAGGIAAGIVAGRIQERVAAVAAKRADGVAKRKDPIVGVTSYANPAEVLLKSRLVDVQNSRSTQVGTYRTRRDSSASAASVTRIAAAAKKPEGLLPALLDAARHEATVGEMIQAIPSDPKDKPAVAQSLKASRLSAEVEALRKAMATVAQAKGHPVRVFLATMGPVAQHKARADFSAGFFAVAGCEVITPHGFATPEEAASAACDSGAEITVLCSTDDTYPAIVPTFCAAVRKVSKDLTIVVAGYPQEHLEAFRAAGVEEFIHMRANVLDTLRTLLAKKGVRP